MGKMIAFLIWAAVGCLFIGLGLSAFFQKKEVGFWANIPVEAMGDVKKYNAAVGKLFIAYGLVFIVLGLPLLSGQNSPLILFSVLGIVAESVAAMAVYNLLICKKYKKP